MKLYHRTIGGKGDDLIILHGLFGSGDNWQTHARYLSQWYKVTLIDQRNHGHSPHADEMNYPLMAHDLAETMESIGISRAHLMGHSMGGKTAMFFAQTYPEKINKLMVIDMGIKAYPPHHGPIFSAIHAVDIQHCPSRKEAELRISPFIPDVSTQQFILKNMYWIEEGKLAWRFNASVLEGNINNILQSVPQVIVESETLFIRGGQSNYIIAEDYPTLLNLFPNASVQSIEKAGHWVHAEAPQEFLTMVLEFLQVVKTD